MVFEGKPLNDAGIQAKVQAQEEASRAQNQAPPPTPAAPKPSAKKESHRFRNFLISSILLGSVLYIGGGLYALEDETAHDLYVDYLPFGEEIIGTIERERFKRRIDNISQLASINSKRNGSGKGETAADLVFKQPGGLQSVSVTGASASTVNKKTSTAAAVTSAKSSTPTSAASSSTSAGFPLLRVPDDIDPLVASSVHALNSFISSVNDSKPSHEHVARVGAEIEALAKKLHDLKTNYQAELSSKLKAETDKASRLVEAQTNEFKTAVAAQEEKWSREFHQEQQRLAETFNTRLQTEINAAKNTIFAAANNKLLSAHVQREKQFAAEVEDRVANEREGRLSKLNELSKDLATIEALTAQAEKVIVESDNAAQLHISIARLKSALESTEPVALGPFIAAIKKTSGEDPLLAAAIDALPESVHTDGVLSASQLAARFRSLEPEIRKASLLPANAGVAGHVGSLVFSKLLWKKSGNATGTDIESILSRAETALGEGRVVDAVGEVNTLKGWPKLLAEDWLAEGRKRSEVEFLVDVVAEEGKLWGLEL